MHILHIHSAAVFHSTDDCLSRWVLLNQYVDWLFTSEVIDIAKFAVLLFCSLYYLSEQHKDNEN